MDELDRIVINHLQGGFPICQQPFAEIAERFGISAEELIARLQALLASGILTRFGPLYQIEKVGGAFSLAAMQVPKEDFERVAAIVNALPEVAHNYERDHRLNMWFVLAAETPSEIQHALELIESRTGYPIYHLPKEREYFVGLRFEA
jgi:DNA-binding Lrp family transcriptional regulator